MFFKLLIVFSALMLYVELELTGLELGTKAGYEEPDAGRAVCLGALGILDHVVNTAFIVELVLNMSLQRLAFFYDRSIGRMIAFNVLDFVIVVLCTFDIYISPLIMTSAATGGNIHFIRLFRLFRLTRAL